MKICMLTSSYLRGKDDYWAVFIHNLAKEMVRQGMEIRVVAPHDVDTKDHEIIDGVEIYRFRYWFTKKEQKVAYLGGMSHNLSHYLLAKIQLPIFMFFFFMKGLTIAKTCDIIHAQFLFSGFIGAFITKFTGKKQIITAHGTDVYTIPKKGLIKKIYLSFISTSECITTVSTANKKKLSTAGLVVDTIEVIPPGIFLSMFSDKTTSKKRKNELRLIWIGRMIEVKGLEYLISAMRIVGDRYPTVNLNLIGEGPLQNEVKQRISELSLNHNITFIGTVKNERIPKYLGESDIFVLPSLSEGLPAVILEAMAAGKPIIASDVGGISEAVEDGVNGFLLEPRNSDQLAEKILYLIEHPEIRKKMGEKSKKIVKDKFTWEKAARRTIKIYENLHL